MTESDHIPTKLHKLRKQYNRQDPKTDNPAATPPNEKNRRTDVCQCTGMNSLSYLPQMVAQMVLSVSF